MTSAAFAVNITEVRYENCNKIFYQNRQYKEAG